LSLIVQTTIVREPATESSLLTASAAASGHGRGPHLKVQVKIRRKPLYYGYTIVAPTLVLCALNLFSFLLPCDNGNKVGIGLTVFLSLYVLQLAIAKNIPESNTLPLIGRFIYSWLTCSSFTPSVLVDRFKKIKHKKANINMRRAQVVSKPDLEAGKFVRDCCAKADSK
jgi:Neurotransmitter-gated ion-channel transmembrane region